MIAMNYSRSMTEAFTFLTLVVTAASMPLYLVGGAAVFKLRRRGVLARGAALSLSAVMTCIFSLWAFYGMGKEAFWWGVALGAVSLPVFWLVRWRQKGQQAAGSTPPAAAPQ
jgi:APA family basic amino acid/polyamine antiporter